MSRVVYDFLTESYLFQDYHIENKFSQFTDDDLLKELELYRGHCLSKLDEITGGIDCDGLNIFSESHRKSSNPFPTEDNLKQNLLYFKHQIVDDPIFIETNVESEEHKSLSAYLGFEKTTLVDREGLAHSCEYMKTVAPLVAGEFLIFTPTSYLHEPPDKIPLIYPEDGYKDSLPESLMKWFLSNSNVFSVKKEGNAIRVDTKSKLKPCRHIAIEYNKHPKACAYLYQLMETNLIEDEGDDRNSFSLEMHIPDTPPDEPGFVQWVLQCLHGSARDFFVSTINEVSLATKLGAYYCTASPFVSELLSQSIELNDERKKIINNFLKLKLPVVSNISLERLMDIRTKEGEAFLCFRESLEAKLKDLREIRDKEELEKRIKEVQEEIVEANVMMVNNKFADFKKGILSDALLHAVGITSVIQSEAWGVLGLAYALGLGVSKYGEYKRSIKKLPGFFVSKLLREQ